MAPMSAQSVTKLKHKQVSVVNRASDIEYDRDEELMASIQKIDEYESHPPAHLTDGPVSTSPSVLMGKMPRPDKILKSGILGKLTSEYEWKEMTTALTSAGLFFARPGSDVLRDLIPLYDVVDVKKRNDVPGDGDAAKLGGQLDGPKVKRGISARTFRKATMTSEGEHEAKSSSLHIIQLRTTDDGYNSGRTYYLRADSDASCNEWCNQLRSAVNQAVLIRDAGPSLFRRAKHHVYRFYHSFMVQSCVAALIFCSFLINIAQTELDGSDSDAAFNVLEILFTVAFAIELATNMFAHFLFPFFKVRKFPARFRVPAWFRMSAYPSRYMFEIKAA
jgi:hypothetical protein